MLHNRIGKAGEIHAECMFVRKGYQVLKRNFHSRYGEIDMIVCNNEYIVFVEVKTRSLGYWVSPLESVTVAKQQKIIKTALLYLQKFPTKLQPRFDVVGITTAKGSDLVLKTEHIENAFEGSVITELF